VSTIAAWLASLGLSEHAQRFAENDIDSSVLRDLTDQDLKDIGISLGHRRRLLRAIAELGGTAPTTPQPAAAAAAPPQDSAERRQLTIMFCDLVGSTALSTRLDPEDLREIISGYHRHCAEVIVKHGGFVARYMGDGVLAYFGYPQAHEDDAERAVRAGLALAATTLDAGSGALQVRVGIATGLVVVGDLIADDPSHECEVVGETPNLAARLQALAEPDTVVIDSNTRRLLGYLFEYRTLGPLSVKGFDDPVAVWQVARVSAVDSRFEALRATTTPLIGRDEEIDLLLRRWDQAKRGDGCVVLISGEPGIGKSRIAETILERLSNEPHTRLRYFCSPHHQDSALYPSITQLERAAGFRRDDADQQRLDKLEAVLAQGTNDLSQAVPLLAELLSIPTGDRHPPLDLTPQKRKEKTLHAQLAQVEGLASRQPVLMVYEDVHWSDPTTRESLDLLIDRVPTLRVLAIITFRPEFTPPWIGRPHVTLLSLNRLPPRQRVEMIARLTGGKALPKEIADQIIDRTDGVPLFIEELTKAVLEGGILADMGERYAVAGPVDQLAIPTSLQASLLARLDRLGPAREVAQTAAAIGRQFSHELISAVAQLPQPQLNDALEQLVGAELIFGRGSAPDAEYIFKHALVQDAAYSTLLRSRRRQLHGRIVGVLEAEFSDIVTSHPEFIAEHCAKSSTPERAIGYWLSAARHAMGRSATTEAITQLQKGLELLISLPDSISRQNHELNLQVALGQAQIASKGYAAPEPTQTYARARQICERLGTPPQLVSVIDGQWSVAVLRGRLTSAQQLAKELLEFGEAHSDTLAIVMGCQDSGDTRLLLGEYTAARDFSLRGLTLCNSLERSILGAIALEDPPVLMLSNLAVALLYLGYFDQARQKMEAAQAEALQLFQPVTLGWALFFNIRFHLAIHAYDVALQLSDELLARIERHGIYLFQSSAKIFRGQCLAALGEPQMGVKLIKNGISAHQASGVKMNLPTHFTSLAQAYGRAAQPELGLRELFKAEEHTEVTGERVDEAEMHRVRGDLLYALHDTAAAEASFCRAISIAQCQNARLPELTAVLSLARLWRDQDKSIEARDVVARIFSWFTEGFDMPVLQDAKMLLDELA
jgi:class 3 adenylate cyclase/tetratricopeptide (TPR) repeat protein